MRFTFYQLIFSVSLFASQTLATAPPSSTLTTGRTAKRVVPSVSPRSTPQNVTSKSIPSVIKREAASGLVAAPEQITLDGPLARHTILASALLPDGSRKDVTSDVTLSPKDASVVSVEGRSVTARGNGKTLVVVRYGERKAYVGVQVKHVGEPIAYSFQNDVVPTMARIGCSSGSCHGANSGKGGFKLSLRGYAPEQDYLAITREAKGRRIAREEPENSLFLRKPLMLVNHGGGKVLEKGSRDYDILLGWLRQGAPGVDTQDPKLVSLAAFPGDRTYKANDTQRMLVRATYSDGRVEDVTHRALFKTNDPAVAKVSDDGDVTALNPGSTAVMAKYMDKLAVLRVTVPYPQAANPAAFRPPVNYVDEAVYAKLRELNLEPSGPCTDAEFLRRVFIDTTGTLPTADEARRFLDSKDPKKREKLIDEALARPEYANVWALKFSDLFLMRKEHMNRKNTLALYQWIADGFRENRPWDRIASDLVVASGSTAEKPQTLWYVSRQQQRNNGRGWIRSPELTGEIVSQVFLGTRINCAKCHNHPTERYTQDDYYKFAAIFAQVNGDGKGDPVPERIMPNDAGEERHLRTGQVMPPGPLDGTLLKVGAKEDRRLKFAAWMTRGAGKEIFARNMANRVWARLFGTGIVEPVDDLRSTNPPKNEALLDALAKDLIAHNYDLKRLMATIMKSRTYGVSSVPTKNNKIDTQFFSHYPVRRLGAEEMLDAVAQVTGVPDKFATYPLGTRAMELSDTELPSLSLDTFGRPPRVMPIDCERNNAPSMSQALDLFNGDGLQSKLKNPEGNLAQLLKDKKSDPQVVEELFLSTLARRPSPKEAKSLLAMIPRAKSREEAMQDVLWVLLNTKEFMFNH